MSNARNAGMMSEPPDEEPKSFESDVRPLDRNNLPEEFTPDFLEHLSVHDALWLEGKADLTARQRETFQAWSKDRFGLAHELAESARETLERVLPPTNWFRSARFPRLTSLGRQNDPLGDDIQKTVAALNDLTGPPRTRIQDPAKRRHEEQQESLRQVYESTDAMRQLLGQLVQRTEQQHQAAERQKTTNWFLAVIAVASTAGTLATVTNPTYFWLALIATFVVAGVLYVVMH
jgi:hypothetical protein